MQLEGRHRGVRRVRFHVGARTQDASHELHETRVAGVGVRPYDAQQHTHARGEGVVVVLGRHERHVQQLLHLQHLRQALCCHSRGVGVVVGAAATAAAVAAAADKKYLILIPAVSSVVF